MSNLKTHAVSNTTNNASNQEAEFKEGVKTLRAYASLLRSIIRSINILKEQHSDVDVVIESQRIMQVEKMLNERNIPFDVTVPDFHQLLAKERSNNGLPRIPRIRTLKKKNIIDWKDFYPLNVIYNFMDALEAEYPATCTVSVIAKTEEGRDLKMLRISNSDASNTAVWMDGAIHAREWISTSVVTYLADYVARNFSTLPSYMANKDWYFVPVLNPDGYAYSHVHDRMWRKNRAVYDGQCCGVDLNRNFSLNWGRSGDFSSKEPDHLNFRGSEPFCEPESSAVKDVISSTNTTFKVFLSFHSYSEVISFPWCHSSDPCPDYVTLLEGGTVMSKAIFESGGHMYKVGSFKDLMYYAGGTSVDWSYGAAKIPFSYLIELRSKDHRFLLPREEILANCKEILHGIKALMKYVDEKNNYCCKIVSKNKGLKSRYV